MKLIEALKEKKDIQRKLEDLRKKITQYSVDYDYETSIYTNQKDVVSGWIQAHTDLVRRIEYLALAIQETNAKTLVPIKLGENTVLKSIAAWILRRKSLAAMEATAWTALTDRGMKDGQIKTTSGEMKDAKVRRYFEQATKDLNLAILQEEPHLIDSRLEVINAVTDLIEPVAKTEVAA